MHLLKHRSIRFYVGFILIFAMAIGGSTIAAFADSSTGANVAVTGGSLSEAAPTSVAATPVTLTGDDQTTTFSLVLTVTDPRGTGAGWKLNISATQFTAGTNKLPTNATTIQGAPTTVSCTSAAVLGNSSGTCTNPTPGTISYPLTVTTGGVPFFTANSTTGLGKFSITQPVTVFIPANTTLGSGGTATFSSTIAVSIVSGP